MKRTFAILPVLALASIMTVAAFGQTSSTQQAKPEHLSKQQLNTLIATANTSAEHERIAQYYQSKAVDYLAQATEHEQMIAAYKANSSLSNDKNQASTIGHCEYFVTTFKALAENSQALADLHERMAKEAPQKLNSAGN
jgi:Tfp pilus assembly protein FimT